MAPLTPSRNRFLRSPDPSPDSGADSNADLAFDLSADLTPDWTPHLTNVLAGIERSNSALRYQNRKLQDQIGRVSEIVSDGAMQLLAAARLALSGITRGLTAGRREDVDEVRSLLDRLEEQLAGCAGDLRPLILEDLGLSAAIQSLCRGFRGAAEIEIVADAAVDLLPPERGLVLYRAVQEALTNAMRHAQPHRVKIRLRENGGEIQCIVRDDGIGFDPSTLFSGSAEPASGLTAAGENLRFIGGSMAVHSNPGSGTEVAITIRVPAAEIHKNQGPDTTPVTRPSTPQAERAGIDPFYRVTMKRSMYD